MAGGGTEAYPDYLENTHKHLMWHSTALEAPNDLITYSIFDLVNTATADGGNPYANEVAYDPSIEITDVDTQLTATKTILDALDAVTDWESFVDSAEGKLSTFEDITFINTLDSAIAGLLAAVSDALGDASITDMVTAFEDDKKVRFLRDVGMWSAGMADLNAVHTSSFVIGLSLMQSEFAKQVDSYEKELKGNVYRDIIAKGIEAYLRAETIRVANKDSMILQGAQTMSNLHVNLTQLQSQLVQMQNEVSRLSIVANKEYKDENLNIDVQDALWDLEATLYASNTIGAIAGAPVMRKEAKNKAQSALSGAAGGAAIGTQIAPGIGTAIGAGIGAIAGALS